MSGSVRETLAWGKVLLASSCREKAHIDSPGLDAALLLAKVLNTNRTGLLMREGEILSEENRGVYQGLLERRMQGECVAYILGRKEFYGLELVVNPTVLVPRPETEILVEAGLEALDELELKNQSAAGFRVLDLCTGSGAISLALKHERPALDVSAVDISAEALCVARCNSQNLHLDIHFIKSDLFDSLDTKFHLIVTNPPYVEQALIKTLAPEVQQEPLLALDGGKDGLNLIRRVIGESPNHLFPGASLLIEAGPEQMDTIAELLREKGFTNCRTYADLAGNLRVIGGKFTETL